MRSTIVLIFEAPGKFVLKISAGQEITYESALVVIQETSPKLKRERLQGW